MFCYKIDLSLFSEYPRRHFFPRGRLWYVYWFRIELVIIIDQFDPVEVADELLQSYMIFIFSKLNTFSLQFHWTQNDIGPISRIVLGLQYIPCIVFCLLAGCIQWCFCQFSVSSGKQCRKKRSSHINILVVFSSILWEENEKEIVKRTRISVPGFISVVSCKKRNVFSLVSFLYIFGTNWKKSIPDWSSIKPRIRWNL